MPSEIMGSQCNTHQSSGLFDDDPCSGVSNREYPLSRSNGFPLNVAAQPIGNFSGDEDQFRVLTTLGVLDRQLLVVDILGGKFQHFADSHAAPGHEFQKEPVPHLGRPEDDFVHRFFFDNIPVSGLARPEEPSQHRGIAGVLNGRIKIGLDEIEEGLEVGVTSVLGLLLSALGDFIEEGENLFGGDGRKIVVCAEVLTKLGEGGTVGLDRIFFQNSSCGTLCIL